jgi:hypothetical protein
MVSSGRFNTTPSPTTQRSRGSLSASNSADHPQLTRPTIFPHRKIMQLSGKLVSSPKETPGSYAVAFRGFSFQPQGCWRAADDRAEIRLISTVCLGFVPIATGPGRMRDVLAAESCYDWGGEGQMDWYQVAVDFDIGR